MAHNMMESTNLEIRKVEVSFNGPMEVVTKVFSMEMISVDLVSTHGMMVVVMKGNGRITK